MYSKEILENLVRVKEEAWCTRVEDDINISIGIEMNRSRYCIRYLYIRRFSRELYQTNK